ncbi:hypothetical protein WJX81_000249 [Elliptochloris bilobata]|uniref:beta-ketoacyl-[acyl-carrier-protein] synthase I n=1 Tax=Elliptochloris bilobata TaxID=381761 RepID=A0AAW1RBN5_9CHLO
MATLVEDAFGGVPQRPARRVVVTGLGLVTPLGVGVAGTWDRLLSGDSGVRTLKVEDLPQGQRAAFPQLPCQVAATVDDEQLAEAAAAANLGSLRRTARCVAFAETAAAEALEDAGWAPSNAAHKDATGVVIGSGMSCTADLAAAGVAIAAGQVRKLSPFLVPRVLANSAAGAVSIRYGLRGPLHSAATACATGAHAIGDAFRLVRSGDADVVVAGGTEACIDAVSLGAFCRMNALATGCSDDPGGAARPFDAGRRGFVLGEGAGVMVLEELWHALARGARIYAELRGYGLSGDAHHITQPPEDGAGAALAVRRALADGALRPADIAYVNAHATGTPLGDAAEARALASVFSGGAVDPSDPPAAVVDGPVLAHAPELLATLTEVLPTALRVGLTGGKRDCDEAAEGAALGASSTDPLLVSSTKGATGHLLGAAGAVEAVFAVLALAEGVAPPTRNLVAPTPDLLPGLGVGAAKNGSTSVRNVLIEFSVAGLKLPMLDALDLDYPLQPAETRLEDSLGVPNTDALIQAAPEPLSRRSTPSGGGAATIPVNLGSGSGGKGGEAAQGGATKMSEAERAAYRQVGVHMQRPMQQAGGGMFGGRRRLLARGGGIDSVGSINSGGSMWGLVAQGRKPEAQPQRPVQPGGSPDAASGSKAEVRFLIGVTSSCCTPKSKKLRAAVRGTWLAYIREHHPAVDVKFIIAQPDSPNRRAAIAAAAELLGAEAAEHGDLVVVRGADAYRNLPNKTVRLLRYMLSSARGYTHVLKTDDDCYVRFETLLRTLRPQPLPTIGLDGLPLSGAAAAAAASARTENVDSVRLEKVYTGCLENQHGFYPLRDPKSKWFISYEEMPDAAVPWERKYLAGWGYVLSRDVAKYIAATVLRYERFPSLAPSWWRGLHWEDVMVGLLAGDYIGEQPTGDIAFVPAWKTCHNGTAVKHLDVDAPRVLRGLYEQQVNEVWQHRSVQCSAGNYISDDYWSWKSWRDSLPNVEVI